MKLIQVDISCTIQLGYLGVKQNAHFLTKLSSGFASFYIETESQSIQNALFRAVVTDTPRPLSRITSVQYKKCIDQLIRALDLSYPLFCTFTNSEMFIMPISIAESPRSSTRSASISSSGRRPIHWRRIVKAPRRLRFDHFVFLTTRRWSIIMS